MDSSSTTANSSRDLFPSVRPINDNSTPSANDGLTITKPCGLFNRFKQKLFRKFSKKSVEQNDTKVDTQVDTRVAPPSLLSGFQETLRSIQEPQLPRQPDIKSTVANTSTRESQEDSVKTCCTPLEQKRSTEAPSSKIPSSKPISANSSSQNAQSTTRAEEQTSIVKSAFTPEVREGWLPSMPGSAQRPQLIQQTVTSSEPSTTSAAASTAPALSDGLRAEDDRSDLFPIGSEQSSSVPVAATTIPRRAQRSHRAQVIHEFSVSGFSTFASGAYDRLIDTSAHQEDDSGQEPTFTCRHPLSDRLPGSYECHDCGYLVSLYWCKCRRCSKRLCERCARHRGGKVWGRR